MKKYFSPDGLDPSAQETHSEPSNLGQESGKEKLVNKFEVFFEAPYAELKKAILETVKPGSNILDLGAYEGRLEDYLEEKGGHYSVQCVDIDARALSALRAKNYQNVETSIIQSDANLFMDNCEGKNDIDTIFLSATLHEINDPQRQQEYLEHFLEKAKTILRPGGEIIIGDFYYPESVSDEEVEAFIEYQKKAINHADARNKFIKPDLIKKVAQSSGFSVSYETEMRAVKQIDRRYYVIILKSDNG